jgi:hypothetical protein
VELCCADGIGRHNRPVRIKLDPCHWSGGDASHLSETKQLRGRRRFEHEPVSITPTPVFPRFEALDDGVLGSLKMLGRVLVRRGVTATHVATGQTESQMHPAAAGLEAFLASARRAWLNRADLS